MKSHRSYSDHEIACYVLGLDMPEHARDIQSRLAQDDAAAARALKWEAYFLGIVDALQPAPPPADVLTRIHSTLGIEAVPAAEDPRLTPPHQDDQADTGSSKSRDRSAEHPWKIGRRQIAIIVAACVVAGLAALIIGANLHHTDSKVVRQPVQLENR